MPAPYRPHQGRTPMAPYLRLCWAEGKRTGSSGQWQVQLARSKNSRVEIFADYKPFTASEGLLAEEVGLVSAREDSVFRAAH